MSRTAVVKGVSRRNGIGFAVARRCSRRAQGCWCSRGQPQTTARIRVGCKLSWPSSKKPEAAPLVAWLCSEEAGWVTGQVIDSEGGFCRWTR